MNQTATKVRFPPARGVNALSESGQMQNEGKQ